MTQIAHICKHLLEGNVLSIMDGFKLFGCTNIPRELSRSVEQKFGVQISRTPKKFKSRYGHVGEYYQYRLNKTEYNKEGIKAMKQYLRSQQKSKKSMV